MKIVEPFAVLYNGGPTGCGKIRCAKNGMLKGEFVGGGVRF